MRLAAPELEKDASITIRWRTANLDLVRKAARLLVLTPSEFIRQAATDLALAALDAEERRQEVDG